MTDSSLGPLFVYLCCSPGLLCLLDDGLHGVDVGMDLPQLLHMGHLLLDNKI